MSKYDKYKESAFTHEEMQPMIIETDMTDIVERLRGNVPMIWGDEGFMITDDDTVLATFKEAADEIERLRDACKNASSYISVRDQFAMAALTGMLMRSVGYEETAEKAYKFADAMLKSRAALKEKE